MACNAGKTPLFRIISTRGYSAQARPKGCASPSVTVKKLSNKIVVASAPASLPVARVAVVFRAGSRYESYENLGISHIIRSSAGLSTLNSTAFAITRNIQQLGGSLSAIGDREIVAFALETTVDKLDDGLRYLADVASVPAFKPWEISDNLPKIRTEIASVPRVVRAVELLHKAAYRNGLGNSVFCPKHQLGNISVEELQHYVGETCTSNRCAVVGVGADSTQLENFAENLCLESGEGPKGKSTYHGLGDVRKDRGGNIAHVAIAGEGCSLADKKEALAFAVLQAAAGIRSYTKRGNINGFIGKPVSQALQAVPFQYSTLNASYSDSGIFGFVLSVDYCEAGKAIDAAVKALKSGSVSDADVQRGKALLKRSVVGLASNGNKLFADLISQAGILGEVTTIDQLVSDIDAVSSAEVQRAAKKVASSKLSLGAIGNLSKVPHASDLR